MKSVINFLLRHRQNIKTGSSISDASECQNAILNHFGVGKINYEVFVFCSLKYLSFVKVFVGSGVTRSKSGHPEMTYFKDLVTGIIKIITVVHFILLKKLENERKEQRKNENIILYISFLNVNKNLQAPVYLSKCNNFLYGNVINIYFSKNTYFYCRKKNVNFLTLVLNVNVGV